MTPIEEADLAQRRWLTWKVGGSAATLALIVLGILVLSVLKAIVVGVAIIVIAVAARLALTFLVTPLANRGLATTHHDRRSDAWWYNTRTHEVEQGAHALGSLRDGPFATREEAARAPVIARERAARWNAED